MPLSMFSLDNSLIPPAARKGRHDKIPRSVEASQTDCKRKDSWQIFDKITDWNSLVCRSINCDALLIQIDNVSQKEREYDWHCNKTH